MSKRLKKKTIILIAIVVVGIMCMGVVISTMQSNMTLDGYETEMKQELQDLPELIKNAAKETDQNTQTYDAIYQSKAQSVSFMANNNAGYKATDAKMRELKELLNVNNVMVVSKSGKIIAQAQNTNANFASKNFKALFTVFKSNKLSEAVEIDKAQESWHMRYYSAKIDKNTMIVIEQDPSELDELVKNSGSTESILKNISFGQSGYMFAVSTDDGNIIYHPDQSLINSNAQQCGIDISKLDSGSFSWMKLNGKSIYCCGEKIDNTYYVAALPKSEISSARNATTAVITFVFFAIMAMIVIYGICVLHEEERRETSDSDYRALGSGVRINKLIAKKSVMFSVVGMVAILVISFYMQTLFALSSQSVTNNTKASEIAQTIQTAKDQETSLREQYSTRYLNKCRMAAYILDNNHSLKNKKDLQALADVLQVQYIDIFDASGKMTLSNSTYTNYTLSNNPKDSSYEFRKLLQGVEHVIQDARTDEISGELRQYIGVVLHNSQGEVDGFVQINIRPSRLQTVLESVQIDNVLDGVKIGSNGFAFAVNKDDKTIAYAPDSSLIGKSAQDCGITDTQLKGGFCDYLTLNGQTYYASSIEQGDYYIYVASSEGELMQERWSLTCATGIIALICLVLIFLILTLERKEGDGACADASANANANADDYADTCAGASPDNTNPKAANSDKSRKFEATLPDGRKVRTETLASRWLLGSFKWHEKTPEQKATTAMKILFGFSVLVIFLAVILRDQIFGENSLFSYIVGGQWEHGVNIFAITACVLFVCVAMTIATIIRRLLAMLAEILEARGATVCRLLGSCIKYGTIIGMAYYCLVLLGVNTTTLLASAGILSIAVSLGAKELVADIISGLFIIFEGEFRVGDIITVGDWRGTVVEIGVRTTKIMDASQNTKVVRNSNVTDVINMTKRASYIWVDVGIEYSESLEHVESILAKELPKFRESIPEILAGPFYKGVVSLGESSVNIRIMVQCSEKNHAQVERDLNREIKLLFDHYDIGIPFPQIVVNQPLQKRVASLDEREDAKKFNIEQREAGKDAEVENKNNG